MRRNNIFVIRKLELRNTMGLKSMGERLRANSSFFSVFDVLPHISSIFLINQNMQICNAINPFLLSSIQQAHIYQLSSPELRPEILSISECEVFLLLLLASISTSHFFLFEPPMDSVVIGLKYFFLLTTERWPRVFGDVGFIQVFVQSLYNGSGP